MVLIFFHCSRPPVKAIYLAMISSALWEFAISEKAKDRKRKAIFLTIMRGFILANLRNQNFTILVLKIWSGFRMMFIKWHAISLKKAIHRPATTFKPEIPLAVPI